MSRFAKAKDAATVTKKKGKAKKARPEVTVTGLTDYAVVDLAIKALDGMKTTLRDDVYEQIGDHFVETGVKTHTQPVNFVGLDVGSTASCQLRKRTSRSFLKPSEIELLDEHGISYKEDPNTVFYINKSYEGDEELMTRVSDALDAANVPDDFLLCKPTNYTTTDDSIREVFDGATDEETLAQLLQIVSTFAARPKFEGSAKEALAKVAEMLED